METSHLSLVKELYKYPLGVGFPRLLIVVFHFHTERENVSSLPKATLWSANVMIRVIGQKALGVPPEYSNIFFHYKEST